MRRGFRCLAALCVVAAAAPVALAQQDLTKRDADVCERKLLAIEARGSLPPTRMTVQPVRTDLSEREVNAFFKYNAQNRMPPGVLNPQVTILGDGHVAGRALVDLDAVRTAQPRSAFNPVNWLLHGIVEVKAAGWLQGDKGMGTFQLESATVGGVAIPKSLLQEVVSYYSKTPDNPDGFSLDKPFPLPANIRAVQIHQGAATILQ